MLQRARGSGAYIFYPRVAEPRTGATDLDWVEASGRGEMLVDGVRVYGRADRIDRFDDGALAIVDYKTGDPPSAARVAAGFALQMGLLRSEEHTSELQSLMRISYAVFCLKKKT